MCVMYVHVYYTDVNFFYFSLCLVSQIREHKFFSMTLKQLDDFDPSAVSQFNV